MIRFPTLADRAEALLADMGQVDTGQPWPENIKRRARQVAVMFAQVGGGGSAASTGQPIDRGPEPASPLPWTAGSPWEVYPTDGINNASCDGGCDGGCDDDERAPIVRCRQLDHAETVVCDTYGLEDFAKRDAGAIAHRVSTYDAICDRAEAAEAELAALASAVRAEQQRAERAERERDQLLEDLWQI